MAGAFSLYTDADIQGPVVKAARHAGWDILRAIEAFPEKTPDEVHLERAATEGRVFVTTDRRIEHRIAHPWLAQGRPFRMICWPQAHRGDLRYFRGAGHLLSVPAGP